MASVTLSRHKHVTCGLPFSQVITEKQSIGNKDTEVFLGCAYCKITRTCTVLDDDRWNIKYDIGHVIEESAYHINAVSGGCFPREGVEYTIRQLQGMVEWMQEQVILPIGEFMVYDESQNERLRYYDPMHSVICRLCGVVGTKGQEDKLVHQSRCVLEKMHLVFLGLRLIQIECDMETKIQWFERMKGKSGSPK
jgi:hypothetical protein